MLAEGTQTPFVAEIVLLTVLVLDKPFVFLVDGVVGQMHVLVILVDLLRVSLRCKSRQTFLVYVNFKRLVTRDYDIDTQVKLVSVDQQWIGDVLGDDARLVHVDIVDVVDDVDASALTRICWFDNPNILFALMLLQLLIMVVKVAELVWQDVGVRGEIEGRLAKPLLQAHNVEAKTILTGNLVRLGEMVQLLVLIETFILIALARA